MVRQVRETTPRKERVIKKKFVEEREETAPLRNFKPSQSQKTVGNLIKQNTLNFVVGPAGTGKSSGVLYEYCKQYLTDPSKHIVIIRTPVEAGGDAIGFLTGSYDDKVSVHFMSARKLLNDFLGVGKVDNDLGKRIHFVVPNYILGDTLSDSLILVDEGQQLTPLILKLLLERIGKGSVCCVVGDKNQLYAKDTRRNGLNDALTRFLDENDVSKYEDVGFFKFTVEDVQRSSIVKTVLTAYEGII